MLAKRPTDHSKPTIMVVGEFAWPWYQEACARALENLGLDVVRFSWFERFRRWSPNKTEPVFHSLFHRVQYALLDGPTVRSINKDLVEAATTARPNIIWFYNVHLIHPYAIEMLRRELPHTVLCQYANDNPFSGAARSDLWRHFLKSIPLMDVHHAYRAADIASYVQRGSSRVSLLRAYFVPWLDYPLESDHIDERYRRDVVFAGHYEPDGRVEALESICRQGHSLSLYGGGWQAALPALAKDSPIRALYPIQPATGIDYNRAICGAKVALCFLSSLNHDTYTRRSFQIPAMRVPMLSQRSEDLETLFTEGEDAVFFSGVEELLGKVSWLLGDSGARERIAEAGYTRVYRDRHDVDSRMTQWLHSLT